MSWERVEIKTYSRMVYLGGKRQHDRRGDPLLEQAAELAARVDLGAEGGHAEVVLGADLGDALLLQGAAHEAARGHERQGDVNAGLDLLREAAPVGRVEGALGRVELGRGDPVVGLVAGAVLDARVRRLRGRDALPDCLQAEGQPRRDGLQVAPDEDARQAAAQSRGVHHLERRGKVVARVLVFDLGHVLAAGGDLEGGLGDELVAPAVVEARRELALIVDVSLHEHLRGIPLALGRK